MYFFTVVVDDAVVSCCCCEAWTFILTCDLIISSVFLSFGFCFLLCELRSILSQSISFKSKKSEANPMKKQKTKLVKVEVIERNGAIQWPIHLNVFQLFYFCSKYNLRCDIIKMKKTEIISEIFICVKKKTWWCFFCWRSCHWFIYVVSQEKWNNLNMYLH